MLGLIEPRGSLIIDKTIINSDIGILANTIGYVERVSEDIAFGIPKDKIDLENETIAELAHLTDLLDLEKDIHTRLATRIQLLRTRHCQSSLS